MFMYLPPLGKCFCTESDGARMLSGMLDLVLTFLGQSLLEIGITCKRQTPLMSCRIPECSP